MTLDPSIEADLAHLPPKMREQALRKLNPAPNTAQAAAAPAPPPKPAPVTGQTVTLTIGTGKRPPLLNNERTRHWTAKHRHNTDWHTATTAAILTNNAQHHHWDTVTIDFRPQYPNARSLPDATATYPATKAIVDTLVRQNLLPDDNPRHLIAETHWAPTVNRNLEHPVIEITIHPHISAP